jgi:antitoxin (DNA-binding transcriptional repressor) of toxin-antitoxin stability system
MKETTIEQFALDPRSVVEASQQERIVLTQDGTPVAVVMGLKNRDAEDVALETSPEFWRMIEDRRRRATRPLNEAKAELFAET